MYSLLSISHWHIKHITNLHHTCLIHNPIAEVIPKIGEDHAQSSSRRYFFNAAHETGESAAMGEGHSNRRAPYAWKEFSPTFIKISQSHYNNVHSLQIFSRMNGTASSDTELGRGGGAVIHTQYFIQKNRHKVGSACICSKPGQLDPVGGDVLIPSDTSHSQDKKELHLILQILWFFSRYCWDQISDGGILAFI